MNRSLVILAITGVCFSVAYKYNVNISWRIIVSDCMTMGQRIADSDDITLYYLCALRYDNGTWYIVQMSCPSGAYFNTTFNDCLINDSLTTTTSMAETTTPSIVSTTSAATTSAATTPAATTPAATTSAATTLVVTTSAATTPAATTSAATTPAVTTSAATTPAATTSAATTPAATTSAATTPAATTSAATTPAGTTSAASTNTPPECTTRAPTACSTAGRYPDDTDCTKYSICLNYLGIWYRFTYSCQSNHYYNPETQLCAMGPCPFTLNPCPTTTTSMMTTTTPTGTTTTTPLPTTIATGGYICPNVGYYPDPFGKCTSYYQCQLVNGIWYYYIYDCPNGTYYDVTTQQCKAGKCPSRFIG